MIAACWSCDGNVKVTCALLAGYQASATGAAPRLRKPVCGRRHGAAHGGRLQNTTRPAASATTSA
jgi:hypothetical protein